MNSRLFLIVLPLLLWTCATPPAPPAPPVEPPKPLIRLGPDDDHRLVSRVEFFGSQWSTLGTATSWKAEGGGVSVTLADGRTARLEFLAASVVRWWVPAAPGEEAFSPGVVRPSTAAPVPKIREAEGVLSLDTPALGVRLRLADLSLSLVRGDKTVLTSAGGPRQAGRRLLQNFHALDQVRWFGPGLNSEAPTAKFWVGTGPVEQGPFAAPALFGSGGPVPVALVLDNSYQTYSRVGSDTVGLGSLNGGLDLLLSAAPQPGAIVEALTAFTGRPGIPPLWAHGTALVLPGTEPGVFVRKAKLAIQTAYGPAVPRPRFQALLTPDSPPAAGAGRILAPFPGRQDWDAAFDGKAPLARMNNLLPSLEAQATAVEWQTANPGLRPLVLAGSGTWGTIRQALPEVAVTAGRDDPLAEVLLRGAVGLGTPAVRLDLTPLAAPSTRTAAFQSLLAWLLAPVLTLDWGPDPARFWSDLPDSDKTRLKAILDRRSQLKPLLAQNARLAAATGRPAWQPLWFTAPADPLALGCTDEFLVGDSLIAAPVTGGASSRSVYLPGPGVWFDFWTGEEFGGGRSYDLEAKPDKPLLFARGGALVPVREAETFDEKDVYNPLTIHVFPGGRGMGTYYLDDGRTLAARGGASWETRLVYDFSQKDMTLDHITVGTTGQLKPDPYLLYRVHNVFKPKQVKIDGKPIPLYGDSWGITDTDRSAAWYEGDHTLLLKTFKPEKEQTITMSF